MSSRRRSVFIGISVSLAVFALARQNEIKHVPITRTSASSGHEMYATYCAACHGKEGRGNGPAAEALKVQPSNLTALAKKNGGKYPASHVSSAITGDLEMPAHGSREMPVWGNLFLQLSQGHTSEVQMRVSNLNRYIESLQEK